MTKKARSDKGVAKSHGMTYSKEYHSWDAMIQRCTNPNHKQAKDYMGRGITICDEWRNSFEQFYRDVGPKPSPRHQLNRINNDEGYYPGNVEWVLPKDNARNRRNNHLVTYSGETLPLCDMAAKYGLTERALCHRLLRGMNDENAVAKPLQEKNKKYTVFGEEGTMLYFSAKYNMSPQLIRQRMKKGMSFEEAVSKPVNRP